MYGARSIVLVGRHTSVRSSMLAEMLEGCSALHHNATQMQIQHIAIQFHPSIDRKLIHSHAAFD